MSAHRNSRRRFLAFLGLMGAVPTSVWARQSSSSSSSDGPPSVDCDASQDTDTYSLRYFQTLNVTPQQTLDDGGLDALISVDVAPSSQTINPPFQDGTPSTAGDNRVDVYHPLMSSDLNSDAVGPSFHVNLIVPSAPQAVRGQLRSGDTVIGDTACTTDSSALTPLNLTISGSFEADAIEPLKSGPVQLTFVIDGQKAAVYTFDFSTIDWQGFKTANDNRFRAAKNVVLNADNSTNVEGCTVGLGDCFFTTATVETLGLSDDCWELRTLRAFRDGPLSRTADGRGLTARYYAEAPRLVEGVNRRPDAARVWLSVYWTHILPCAVMARLGFAGPALAHYKRLFQRLERLAA